MGMRLSVLADGMSGGLLRVIMVFTSAHRCHWFACSFISCPPLSTLVECECKAFPQHILPSMYIANYYDATSLSWLAVKSQAFWISTEYGWDDVWAEKAPKHIRHRAPWSEPWVFERLYGLTWRGCWCDAFCVVTDEISWFLGIRHRGEVHQKTMGEEDFTLMLDQSSSTTPNRIRGTLV